MSDTAQVRFTSKGEDLITEDVLNGKKNKKEKNKKKTSQGEDLITADVLNGKQFTKKKYFISWLNAVNIRGQWLFSKCNRALTFAETLSVITDAAFTRTGYLETHSPTLKPKP